MGAIARRVLVAVAAVGILVFSAGPAFLSLAGSLIPDKALFDPYELLGLYPIVWGLAVSGGVGILVSLLTIAPPAELVSKLFDAPSPADRRAAAVVAG